MIENRLCNMHSTFCNENEIIDKLCAKTDKLCGKPSARI